MMLLEIFGYAGFDATLVYLSIGFGTLFLIINIMSMFGGDMESEVDADGDMDGDADGEFPIFTVKNIINFILFFSLTTLICKTEVGLGQYLSMAIGTVVGVSFTALMAWAFKLMMGTQQDNSIDYTVAVGQSAVVYMSIPENGTGQVKVIVGGTQQFVDAQTKDKESRNTGETVKVIDNQGNLLIVN